MKKKRPSFTISEYIPLITAIILFIGFAILSSITDIFNTSEHPISFVKMEVILDPSDYDLLAIRKGAEVPRIFIKSMPADFNKIKLSHERKNLFIKFLLPLVLKANNEISYLRNKIIATDDKDFLNELFKEYKVATKADLLAKIDIIPVSLVLAQGAEETGWGSSRFLLDGNSIFAEWTWKDDGMKPKSREKGKTHRVKTFPTLYDSVKSYMNNLNTTKYYYGFRNVRADMRAKKQPLDSLRLAETLTGYSTQRNNYVKDLKAIITANKLKDFDNAKLAPPISKIKEE